MKYNEYEIDTVVWLYPGMAGWHFVTIPQDLAADIKRHFGTIKRGWGSIPVRVTINRTTWETSIFPDKQSNGYLLPIKADVRKKEHISVDEKVHVLLEIKK